MASVDASKTPGHATLSGKKRKLDEDPANTTTTPTGNQEETNDDEDLPPSKYFRPAALEDNIGRKCPYLDQINRKALDFDFEKVCSVTMSNHNVYGCLVCGAYFAGRSKNSPSYFHALQENHRIFIHLDNGKIYCLPDDYEVIDASLNDIKHNLHPTFTAHEIYALDNHVEYAHALNERDYLPGVIGLNNLNNTDWLNVVVQSLMRVKPLRDYFVEASNYDSKRILATRFGELVRKYFNPHNFKGQVSPHELLQAVSLESTKKFQIGKQSDPLAFLAWFLNQLHRDLGGNKKHHSSVVSKTLQGLITITTYTRKKKKQKQGRKRQVHFNDEADRGGKTEYDSDEDDDDDGEDAQEDVDMERKDDADDDEDAYEVSRTEQKPFFFLLLDLPTMPLFKDSEEAKFIPQIPLTELLSKFNGSRTELLPDGSKKVYTFARLPPYLLIAFGRFHENNFLVEKNSTIVGFVLKGLDLKEYLHPMECDRAGLSTWTVKKLKKRLSKYGVSQKQLDSVVEKNELVEEIMQRFPDKKRWKTKYDLIAQIVNDGKEYHKGSNRALIYHPPNNMWYEMQDLHVEEKMPQIVAISEAYIQCWRRKETKF